MSVLWVLSGGPEACPVIERATELGHRVVASDFRPEAPGLALASRGVVASVYDPEETLNAARRFAAREGKPDGVLCAAADAPRTASRLAEYFGLPAVSLHAASLATDKLAMKERLAEAGVPIPWFHPVLGPDHLEELFQKEGPPLIVKPADSRGARGVIRLDEEIDLGWAYAEARHHSPSGRVLVERFLEGPQVSTESLAFGSRVETPGFADRNYEFLERYAPFVVENGGDLPTRLPLDIQDQARDVVTQAAVALGLDIGVVKGDLVIHEGQAYVIELAARLSGGYLCSHHIPLSTGVDFVGAAIRQAVGEPVDPVELHPQKASGVAQRYFFPPPGLVTRVEGESEVAGREEVAMLELRVGPDDRIEPIQNHPGRAGLVIACGRNREDAIKAAESAIRGVLIETQ